MRAWYARTKHQRRTRERVERERQTKLARRRGLADWLVELRMGWQQRRREEMRLWWRAFKATKSCLICGEAAPECLHFHHRDPSEKEVDLGRIVSGARWSKQRILEEVAKCDVLCAKLPSQAPLG